MKPKGESKRPDEPGSVEHGCVQKKRANRNPEVGIVAVKQVTMGKHLG
jgi:hypothetical protein